MDTVTKREAGEALNARDETRLRNHQLRMMRRAWLRDMKVSPREPLWPANDVWFGKGLMRPWLNFTNNWKLLSDKLFLPQGVRPFYHLAFLDELMYGRIQYLPRLALWGAFRALRYFPFYFTGWLIFKTMHEALSLDKYPTAYGCLPHSNSMAVTAGRAAPYYPSDKTFTTRLRNVEFGHDYMTLNEYTPRMKPDAKQYPEGTRMNWVTFQPILPEENYLLNEEYGNGPGGLGPMTETYRLVHATKAHGLYSKTDPDEPHVPGSRAFRWFMRTITNRHQVDDENAAEWPMHLKPLKWWSTSD